ncbi:MAG TPA: hypothetical protein VHE35_26100 [Kofleriaceae bacterium]|nr:hypothetical protein [Kofleriaceae bacterium]
MRSNLLLRVAVAAVTLSAAAPGAARAGDDDDDDPGGGSILAVGFGPSARVSGGLAARVHGDGAAGRIRFGGRIGHWGYELDTSVIALAADDLGDLDDVGIVLAVPTFAWYPVAGHHAQLALRGGLGYGSLAGDHLGPAPACSAGDPECPGRSLETVTYHGYALDVGVTATLHLGRRHGGRALLWADLGASLARFRIDDQLVDGKVVTLTFGIGHGMEF